jgi:hypothetical protein
MITLIKEMNDTFLTKPRKALRRTPFKSKNTSIKPKIASKRKKSTRVKLVPLGKLQRTCDALMQQVGKLKNPKSLISNLPTQVMHHYIPKSCSSILRYNWDNLIPLTNGEHCSLHQSPDPTTNILILQAKGGQKWFDKLKEKGRQYNKVNRAYYEAKKLELENELLTLQCINNYI